MKEQKVIEVIFLDKELSQIIPASFQSNKYADKLARIRFDNGAITHLLVHVEVQGYYDANFSEQMFTYFYRIYDYVGPYIEALTLFTYPEAEPGSLVFDYKMLKTHLMYQFHVCKLWEEESKRLYEMDSPFALALLAAKEAICVRKKSDEQQLAIKLRLGEKLLALDYDITIITKLFQFISNYLKSSSKEFDETFQLKFQELKLKEKAMGIIELIAKKKPIRRRHLLERKNKKACFKDI